MTHTHTLFFPLFFFFFFCPQGASRTEPRGAPSNPGNAHAPRVSLRRSPRGCIDVRGTDAKQRRSIAGPCGGEEEEGVGEEEGVCVCHTPSSSSSPLTPHALPLSSCVCVCVATPSSSSSDPSEQRRRPRKGARVYIDGSHQPDTPTHTACRCGQRRVLPVSPVSGRLVPTGARGAPFAMHPRGRRKA